MDCRFPFASMESFGWVAVELGCGGGVGDEPGLGVERFGAGCGGAVVVGAVGGEVPGVGGVV